MEPDFDSLGICGPLKRIKREWNQLNKTNIVNAKIACYSLSEWILEIFEKEDNNIIKFSFIIPANYPFVPPKIEINNTKYISRLCLFSPRFIKVLKKISNKHCLCCCSILCRGNWSPSYTITKIMDEVKNNRETIKNVIIKILVDKIKDTYLIADINLEEWLFKCQ